MRGAIMRTFTRSIAAEGGQRTASGQRRGRRTDPVRLAVAAMGRGGHLAVRGLLRGRTCCGLVMLAALALVAVSAEPASAARAAPGGAGSAASAARPHHPLVARPYHLPAVRPPASGIGQLHQRLSLDRFRWRSLRLFLTDAASPAPCR